MHKRGLKHHNFHDFIKVKPFPTHQGCVRLCFQDSRLCSIYIRVCVISANLAQNRVWLIHGVDICVYAVYWVKWIAFLCFVTIYCVALKRTIMKLLLRCFSCKIVIHNIGINPLWPALNTGVCVWLFILIMLCDWMCQSEKWPRSPILAHGIIWMTFLSDWYSLLLMINGTLVWTALIPEGRFMWSFCNSRDTNSIEQWNCHSDLMECLFWKISCWVTKSRLEIHMAFML